MGAMARKSTHESLFSGPSAESLSQFLIDRSTVTHGHQADDSCFLMNGIDDTKAANAIFS